MTLATSLIPGLDELVRGDDPKRRAEAVRRIAELFFDGAGGFRPEHVEFFDGILIDLVRRTSAPTSPNGLLRSSMRHATWSASWRVRTRSQSQVRCSATRP